MYQAGTSVLAYYIAMEGKMDIITYLVCDCKVDLEAADKARLCSVWLLCVCVALLCVCVDECCIVQESWTALHRACRYGRMDVVKLLEANGANMTALTKVWCDWYMMVIMILALMMWMMA